MDTGGSTDGAPWRHGLALVHGGAHGSWCWSKVRAELAHPSIAVDLPGRSSGPGAAEPDPAQEPPRTIADHARSVVEQIDDAGLDRVVLAGHSLGGLVLPLVARQLGDRVRHVVFVSALVAGDAARAPDTLPPPLRQLVTGQLTRIAARPGATVTLPPWSVRFYFCNGLSAEDTATVLRSVCPEPAAPLADRLPAAQLPPDLPRTYLGFRSDRAIPPIVQRRFARSIGAPWISVEGGHDGMIGNAPSVARVLNWIARDALG